MLVEERERPRADVLLAPLERGAMRSKRRRLNADPMQLGALLLARFLMKRPMQSVAPQMMLDDPMMQRFVLRCATRPPPRCRVGTRVVAIRLRSILPARCAISSVEQSARRVPSGSSDAWRRRPSTSKPNVSRTPLAS